MLTVLLMLINLNLLIKLNVLTSGFSVLHLVCLLVFNYHFEVIVLFSMMVWIVRLIHFGFYNCGS